MENKDKKYIMTDEARTFKGHTLHRIKAIKSFGDIKEGDLGGFIESEENLSQYCEAWIYRNGCVYEDATVWHNAKIGNKNATADDEINMQTVVYGRALVSGQVHIFDKAVICGDAATTDNCKIYGNAYVDENAWVRGCAEVSGNARIEGSSRIGGNAKIYGEANISGSSKIYGEAVVSGNANIDFNTLIDGNADIALPGDYLVVQGLGERNSSITAYRDSNNGISVTYGYFIGTLDEFEQMVIKEHRENRLAKEYLKLIDLLKYHFGLLGGNASSVAFKTYETAEKNKCGSYKESRGMDWWDE